MQTFLPMLYAAREPQVPQKRKSGTRCNEFD